MDQFLWGSHVPPVYLLQNNHGALGIWVRIWRAGILVRLGNSNIAGSAGGRRVQLCSNANEEEIVKLSQTNAKSVVVVAALVWIFGCDSSQVNVNFTRDRLNDGIQVGAPDDWRWVRDGLPRESVLLLAGNPIKDYDPKEIKERELGVWEYKTEIEGAVHRLAFDRDGLLRFCEWYKEMKEDPSLSAPTAVSSGMPEIRFPRCMPMVWTGDSENGYEVAVEILHGNQRDQSANYFTKNKRAVHQHTGMNEGRWRVRKLSFKGFGPWSEYVEFKCVQ